MTSENSAPASVVYLDHAATTPMHPEAAQVLTEQLARTGNASSLHASGRAARRVVEESREVIAECLGARPSEVVFTSGGTEANNLAIKGLYWARRDVDPARDRVLFSSIEHHALLDPVTWLAAAVDERLDAHAPTHPQHPDALRSAELVRREAERLDAEHSDVERQPVVVGPGRRLDRVGVERDPVSRRHLRQRGDRLDGADLVAGVLHAHHGRVVAQHRSQVAGVDETVAVDLELGDVVADAAEPAGRLQDRRVLDGAHDHVASPRLGECDALDGRVRRLGPPRGERDLAGARTESLGDVGARLLQAGTGGVADLVVARRVPERRTEVGARRSRA